MHSQVHVSSQKQPDIIGSQPTYTEGQGNVIMPPKGRVWYDPLEIMLITLNVLWCAKVGKNLLLNHRVISMITFYKSEVRNVV